MFVESVVVNDKGKLDHYSAIIRPIFESESTTELKIALYQEQVYAYLLSRFTHLASMPQGHIVVC
ncbi:hypothetical protein H4J58_17310 [Colwellia sp. MB3u-70]|uniref:hypothetical protein n=1 Tax=unclassified Colwellia TaxID=196834 RepID=UPI0015F65568|nr:MULTISPECIES: hypothetical protein [unclassified Colwellia]MBA6293700.1 hypothetical protein [Colwellia sp. MB3u-8]MBA6308873.1 hypothetical protein [Colwellia sp. MB3u-70]